MRRINSRPSIPGIIQSLMTMGKSPCLKRPVRLLGLVHQHGEGLLGGAAHRDHQHPLRLTDHIARFQGSTQLGILEMQCPKLTGHADQLFPAAELANASPGRQECRSPTVGTEAADGAFPLSHTRNGVPGSFPAGPGTPRASSSPGAHAAEVLRTPEARWEAPIITAAARRSAQRPPPSSD